MPGPLTRAIAAALSAAVAERRLTQAQIAAALGQSQPHVSKYLRGEIVLDVEELNAICAFLHINTATLIAESLKHTEP
jgi:transcriptional regulator with XRE-family HTH domain